MRERDEKDYAVEFGEYLAQAAEFYMRKSSNDAYTALRRAIYEFRKRAAKAWLKRSFEREGTER